MARCEKQKDAKRKYQQSSKGRSKNAARQKIYREKKRKKKSETPIEEKKVTYQGLQDQPLSASLETVLESSTEKENGSKKKEQFCCDFCGRKVSLYLRRSFIDHNAVKIQRNLFFITDP